MAPVLGPENGTRACSLVNKKITRGPKNDPRFGAEKRHQNWGRVSRRHHEFGLQAGPLFGTRYGTKFGAEFGPRVRQIQYTLSANIILSVETFLQCLLDCATPKVSETAAAFIASPGITPHHAAQHTSTSTATLRGGGVVEKTVPPGGP